MKFIVFCLTLLVSIQVVSAYDYEQALNNQSHEMSACAAYFTFVSSAAGGDERDKKDKLSEKYEKQALIALDYAEMMSNPKVAEARMKIEMDKIMKATGGSKSNISILFAEYAETCKAAIENPFVRLRYWINKK